MSRWRNPRHLVLGELGNHMHPEPRMAAAGGPPGPPCMRLGPAKPLWGEEWGDGAEPPWASQSAAGR